MGIWVWIACADVVGVTGVEVFSPPLGEADDHDQDGITDLDEDLLGTSRLDADTDGDTVLDGEELLLGIDPSLADTDGDGARDGDEIELGIDPSTPDSDGGGAWDGDELAAGAAPDDPRDDDGVPALGAFVGGGGCTTGGSMVGPWAWVVALLRLRVRR